MTAKRLAAASVLVGTLILATGCSQPEMKLGVQTYTFRTYTLIETLDKVQELDLDYIEAFSGQKVAPEFGDMRFDHKSSPEAREIVKAKLAETGIELVGFYYHHLGQDEADSRKVFEFAREMGVKVIVTEPPAATLPLIDKLANEYDIDIAIHNHASNPEHPEYVNWNPEAVMEMIADCSDRVGTCADTGHWTRSGVIPADALKVYQDRLKVVHLKDMNKAELKAHDVVWGKGKADMAAVFAELHRQGFAGLASIEYEENPDDNMAELADCIEYYEQVTDELNH